MLSHSGTGLGFSKAKFEAQSKHVRPSITKKSIAHPSCYIQLAVEKPEYGSDLR